MQVEDEEKLELDLKAHLESQNKQLEDLKSSIRALYNKTFNTSGLDSVTQGLSIAQRPLTCNCTCHDKINREVFDVGTQTFESDFIDQDSTQSALDWATENGTNVSDLVREVVEHQSDPQNDYVYDETYRMYYSVSTGYYYDTERNLLYDPRSQAYYKYDSSSNSYEVYYPEDSMQDMTISDKVNDLKLDDETKNVKSHRSEKPRRVRVRTQVDSIEARKEKKRNDKIGIKNKSGDNFVPSDDSSTEEGEIHSDSSENNYSDCSDVQSLAASFDMSEDSYESWPPCIRAVIKESAHQKIGDLVMITCVGGIIGREETNAICIPDLSISREHAKIMFDNETWQYGIIDLNSQNGTFVNDAQVQGESVLHPLNHGDILGLGSSKLLLHIHKGRNTCNECEPGIVQAMIATSEDHDSSTAATKFKTKEEKEQERRQNLKQMKKKFGLKDMDFTCNEKAFPSQNYQDRSRVRRKEKGSQNPYEKDEYPTSLVTALPSSNKGYKMLVNMGWTEGKSVGLGDTGILEPVNPWCQSGKAGLGSEPPPPPEQASGSRRSANWKKAQKRYRDIERS